MKKVLFLCTGNTCRSPMAECLFNQLCESRGLPFSACSAGLYAKAGAPASEGALAVMKERGLSLLRHNAQPLTETLVKEVCLIMAMTSQHVVLCQERFPDLSIPVRSFSPPIPDPFGGSMEIYRTTAGALEEQILGLTEELDRLK